MVLYEFLIRCRYFTLFMNLLNDCSEEATEEKCNEGGRKCASSNLSALRNCTVLAMSNLLNANIDSGLMHSIGQSVSCTPLVSLSHALHWSVCLMHSIGQSVSCTPLVSLSHALHWSVCLM